MEGVWRRQIRFARSILLAVLKVHGISLNDESLQIFFAEVEAIVHTRRITSESSSDVLSPNPFCRMPLLTIKSRVVMLPQESSRKRRYIVGNRGDICNEFWSRWKKDVYAT